MNPEKLWNISDHKLIQQIGSGSYGEVWRALSLVGTERAVKIVCRSRFDSDRPYDREFAGIRRFEPVSRRHEGLVDVLHLGRASDDSYFYYVMELADPLEKNEVDAKPLDAGYVPKTLRAALRDRARQPLSTAIQLGIDIAGALGHLHKHGLVHRDIKPSNIIYVKGQPKLADIGLVTGVDEAKSFVGTEGYISPEGPGSPQADLYSLGKVLYEAATGKDRHEFPELPEDFRGTPEGEGFSDFNEILLRACASDPAKRYATAEQMRAELLLLQSGRSIRGLRANEQLVRRLKVAAVAAAGILLLTAGVILFQRQRAAERSVQLERRREIAYAADMALAFQGWEIGRAGLARELLQASRPRDEQKDLRGWEWRYLWQASRPHEVRVLRAPTDNGVWSCAFSPDGRIVAGGLAEGFVALWDAESGKELPALGKFFNPVAVVDTVMFTKDGKIAVHPRRQQGTVLLWDVESQTLLREFQAHPKMVFSSQLSPDGEWLATVAGGVYSTTSKGSIKLWRTKTLTETNDGNPLEPYGESPQQSGLIRCRFSSDAQLLVVVGANAYARVFSIPDLSEAARFPEHGDVFDGEFSPDRTLIATGNSDGVLHLWKAGTWELLWTKVAHAGSLDRLAFSPDGRTLATGGRDHIVRLWDVAHGQERFAFKGHAGRVIDVKFSPDGKWLASAGQDQSVRLWDAHPEQATDTLNERLIPLNSVTAFSPDNHRWAIPASTNHTELIELNGLHTSGFVEGTGPAFSADGRWLATYLTNRVFVFDASSHAKLRDLISADPLTNAPVFSPESTLLAMLTADGGIIVWQLAASEAKTRIDSTNGPAIGLFFFNKGRELMVVRRTTGLIEWFDIESGRLLRSERTGTARVSSAALTPDGRHLAIGETGPRVRLWSAATGRTEILNADAGSIVSLAWSRDGQTLAAGTFEGVIKLWNLRTRREVGALRAHISMVLALAFSPDGRRLGSAGVDNSCRLWTAPALVETAAERQE
jgi:WD40 repeat protein